MSAGAGEGEPPARRGAFVRDSAAIALAQYVARAMVLVRGWASALALGPAGYGSWNALNLVFEYGSYASLGALQGLDLALPAAVARGERDRARRLMASALAVIAAGGAAFAAGTLLVAGRAAGTFTADPRLVALMLAAALLQLVFQYFATALRAHGRFGAVSAGQSTQAVLGAGLGIVLVWRYGLWGLLAGWIAGTLVALARMRRATPEAPLAPGFAGEGVALARLGFPIFAYYVLSLVLRSVDRMALVRYGDPATLGTYGVGLMAAGLVLFVPESAAYVLFPRIAAAAHGAVDRDQVRADVLRAQRGLAALMPALIALAILWAEPVLRLLLPRFAGAAPAFRMLAAGALALSAATIPSYLLLGGGKARSLLALGAFAAAAQSALVFLVARARPEPAAVAAASTAGYALFAVLILARAAFELRDGARERVAFVAQSLGPAAWAAALSFAAERFLRPLGPWAPLAGTVLVLALYWPVARLQLSGLGLREQARRAGRGP